MTEQLLEIDGFRGRRRLPASTQAIICLRDLLNLSALMEAEFEIFLLQHPIQKLCTFLNASDEPRKLLDFLSFCLHRTFLSYLQSVAYADPMKFGHRSGTRSE